VEEIVRGYKEPSRPRQVLAQQTLERKKRAEVPNMRSPDLLGEIDRETARTESSMMWAGRFPYPTGFKTPSPYVRKRWSSSCFRFVEATQILRNHEGGRATGPKGTVLARRKAQHFSSLVSYVVSGSVDGRWFRIVGYNFAS
jgi:hypothetical protein